MYPLVSVQGRLSLLFIETTPRPILSKFSMHISEFPSIQSHDFASARRYHVYENPMTARPAWILKDAFALYCSDMQAFLDSSDFIDENCEVNQTNASRVFRFKLHIYLTIRMSPSIFFEYNISYLCCLCIDFMTSPIDVAVGLLSILGGSFTCF